MHEPLISIIIPVYNVEKYLSECLDSVIAQTYQNWEAICVNDGSPDNCAQILDKYTKKDKRFIVINKENEGLSMARNKGLRYAKGEYIYFLDSDDSIHPQLLEVTYNLAQKYDAELVSFGFIEKNKSKFVHNNIKLANIKTKITNNPILVGTYKEKYRINFNVWTKLYKKRILDSIDFIPKIHFEDFPHTFAVLSKKPKTVIIRDNLYFYSQNEDSISHQKGTPEQIKDYFQGIRYIYEIYSTPEFKKELAFLKRNFIPNILKQQLGRCNRADNVNRSLMLKEFTKELIYLKDKDLLSWRGHKLVMYLKYKKMIKGKLI